MKGLIFQIEEFALFDGDGIRVNVFFKGCPLRCKWCHNPEGLTPKIQIVKNVNACVSCNLCKQICSNEKCIACLKCVKNCPRNALRSSGYCVTPNELATKILSYQKFFELSGGGVTFSGGEVLMQPNFLLETLKLLPSVNKAIETSGYGDSQAFAKIINHVNVVYFDLKVMDSEKHKFYTGKSNKIILKNAKILFNSNTPCVVRVPLISNVNTSVENLTTLLNFVKNAKNLQRVEFLCYNKMAGAKYQMLNLKYKYDFCYPTENDLNAVEQVFKNSGVNYTITK